MEKLSSKIPEKGKAHTSPKHSFTHAGPSDMGTVWYFFI